MEENPVQKFVISPDSGNGINVLSGVNSEGMSYRIAEDFVSILKSTREVQYSDTYVGPRMEDLATRGIVSISKIKGITLVDFYNLMKDEEIRNNFYNKTNDSALKKYLEEINSLSREEKIGTERALARLALDPGINSMICNPTDEGNLSDAIDKNDLLIVNLDKGTMGYEDSRILSNVFAVYIWFIISIQRRGNYFLFLEEAQDYQSNLLADMLSSGRKFGLRVFFVTTSFTAIAKNLESMILSNVSNFVFLRLSSPDRLRVKEFFGRDLYFPTDPFDFSLVNGDAEEKGKVVPVKFPVLPSNLKNRNYNYLTQESSMVLSEEIRKMFLEMEKCSSTYFIYAEFINYFNTFSKNSVVFEVKKNAEANPNIHYVGRVNITSGIMKGRHECFELVGKGDNCPDLPKAFQVTSALISKVLEKK